MLLYFSVQGYLSFEQTQEFYLTSPQGARLKNTKYHNNFHLNLSKLNRPMKSAVFFGDNASGKTNILYSLQNLINIIKDGFTQREKDENERYNRNSDTVAYEIEVADSRDNVYYYTIEYSIPRGKQQPIELKSESFTINGEFIFRFANNLLEISDLVDQSDLLETLFRKGEQTNTYLSKLRDFIPQEVSDFRECINQIQVVTDRTINFEQKGLAPVLFSEEMKELLDNSSEETLKILQCVDKTITDIELREIDSEEGDKRYEVIISRNDTEYNLRYESKGVKKIIHLLNNLLSVQNGKTVLVDELDESIGTKALIRIFNQFINSAQNQRGQLIISSHNLYLLDFDLFHPSQLFVLSKSKDLYTNVLTVDDFELRKENKSLYSLYLNGSFEV